MRLKIKPKPQYGTQKEKIKFALFPTKVENKWVWFERYIAIYKYENIIACQEPIFGDGSKDKWCRVDKKLISTSA